MMLEPFNGYGHCIYLFLCLGTTEVVEKRSNSSNVNPCAKRMRPSTDVAISSATSLTPEANMSTPVPVVVATTASVQSCTVAVTTATVQSSGEAIVQSNRTTPVRLCAKPKRTTPDVSVIKILCMYVFYHCFLIIE